MGCHQTNGENATLHSLKEIQSLADVEIFLEIKYNHHWTHERQ
jgi:hypothetical protein